MFRDDADRLVFLGLMQKHLIENDDPDSLTRTYDVQIVAYCLMGTHFHLLLFQGEDLDAITGYMRSVGTAYSMYYNRKYKSKGHVFQSSFRASHINSDAYLAHITRYIHLNPRHYRSYAWSSYSEYVDQGSVGWVHPELVLKHSERGEPYERFVASYAEVDRRKQATELKDFLAF